MDFIGEGADELIALQGCLAGRAFYGGGEGADHEQAVFGERLLFLGARRAVGGGEAAGEDFDGAPAPAQVGDQDLLFQRGVKATEEDAAFPHPVRHAVERFDEEVAGALARGEEAEQWLGQQRRVAHADDGCRRVSGDASGKVGWQEDGCGFHATGIEYDNQSGLMSGRGVRPCLR